MKIGRHVKLVLPFRCDMSFNSRDQFTGYDDLKEVADSAKNQYTCNWTCLSTLLRFLHLLLSPISSGKLPDLSDFRLIFGTFPISDTSLD